MGGHYVNNPLTIAPTASSCFKPNPFTNTSHATKQVRVHKRGVSQHGMLPHLNYSIATEPNVLTHDTHRVSLTDSMITVKIKA